jgi:S-adenosylmethionine hydrolase
VDRYGNCQLNIDPDDIAAWGDRVQVRWTRPREGTRTATRSRAFDDLKTGQVGLLTDSYGLLAVVVSRGSAADTLGLLAGDEVALVRLDDDAPEGAPPVPVTLQTTRSTSRPEGPA